MNPADRLRRVQKALASRPRPEGWLRSKIGTPADHPDTDAWLRAAESLLEIAHPEDSYPKRKRGSASAASSPGWAPGGVGGEVVYLDSPPPDPAPVSFTLPDPYAAGESDQSAAVAA